MIPALANKRVGSLTGTTGLDFQLTWFLSSKNLKKVSRTLVAGHSTTWGSAPGMAATAEAEKREINEWWWFVTARVRDGFNKTLAVATKDAVSVLRNRPVIHFLSFFFFVLITTLLPRFWRLPLFHPFVRFSISIKWYFNCFRWECFFFSFLNGTLNFLSANLRIGPFFPTKNQIY